MKIWIVVALLALSACTLSHPTGYAVAPPTHWEDGNQVYVKTSVVESIVGDPSLTVKVTGDLVYDVVYLNGKKYQLYGVEARENWLSQEGVVRVHLPEGEYELLAHSCVRTFASYKCGCINEDNCGHWMKSTVKI